MERVVEARDVGILAARDGDCGDPARLRPPQSEGALLRRKDADDLGGESHVDLFEEILEARAAAGEEHGEAQLARGVGSLDLARHQPKRFRWISREAGERFSV